MAPKRPNKDVRDEVAKCDRKLIDCLLGAVTISDDRERMDKAIACSEAHSKCLGALAKLAAAGREDAERIERLRKHLKALL